MVVEILMNSEVWNWCRDSIFRFPDVYNGIQLTERRFILVQMIRLFFVSVLFLTFLLSFFILSRIRNKSNDFWIYFTCQHDCTGSPIKQLIKWTLSNFTLIFFTLLSAFLCCVTWLLYSHSLGIIFLFPMQRIKER